MSNPVPEIGDIVEYGLNGFGTAVQTWRVSSWIRIAPQPEPSEDDFIGQILFEACQEIEATKGRGKKRMQFCLQSEATHVSLSGICGAIAAIEECKVVGKVDWTGEMLSAAERSANRRGAAHEMIF